MPSGPRVAAISRSLSTELKWWPSRAPTTWCTGGATWETHEHDAEGDQGCGQVGAVLDAPDQEPGGDGQAGGDQRAHQQDSHHAAANPGTERVIVTKKRVAGRTRRSASIRDGVVATRSP